ncbi:WD40-repeat-containing domain protein [Cladochytrium replicatum]|nr:WD40-repeat-containing domain protein [Cladochytrium replicatum]
MDADELLTPQVVDSFKLAKVHADYKKPITSLDFDASGELCLTTAGDDALRIYDCRSGDQSSKIFSKKYGCSFAKFTHRKTNVLYASTKEDDTIRYLSTHDNKFLRYFKGHTRRVTSLDISPTDDQFISASQDSSVRLWDLRSSHAHGQLNIGHDKNACVAFDQEGIVFGVGIASKAVKLYDVRNYSQGPFATFTLEEPTIEWVSVKFSNDGKSILISTRGEVMYLLDAFSGAIQNKLTGHENRGLSLDGCFTPDCQYVICGSSDGFIHFWNKETGNLENSLEGHREPITMVGFNPKFMMLASAEQNLGFWLPIPPEA